MILYFFSVFTLNIRLQTREHIFFFFHFYFFFIFWINCSELSLHQPEAKTMYLAQLNFSKTYVNSVKLNKGIVGIVETKVKEKRTINRAGHWSKKI